MVSCYAEIEKLALTVRQGQWQWVGLAALLQVLFYLLHTVLYQNTFFIVGIDRRLRDMLSLVLAALFVNVVAPTGGTAAIALFMDDASLRGQPAARAAAGTLLTLVVDFSAFSLLLAAGIIYLFRQADLRPYQVTGAILFLLFILLLSSLLLLGLWQPALLQLVLIWCHWCAGWVSGWSSGLSAGRIGRPETPPNISALQRHQRRPGGCRAFVVSLASHLVNLACVYAIFLAFRWPAGLRTAGGRLCHRFRVLGRLSHPAGYWGGGGRDGSGVHLTGCPRRHRGAGRPDLPRAIFLAAAADREFILLRSVNMLGMKLI